jgi:DNA-binding response OmpR family regulator
MRILVAEDHPELGADVKRGLEQRGYRVDLVARGDDALTLGLATSYDLLLLDILLPGLSGFEVCRRFRAYGAAVPILLLTALSEVHHHTQGLDLGADDYLSKPFDFQELEARVRALLQCKRTRPVSVLRFLDLTLDLSTQEVRRGERLLALSSKEYALLKLFMTHPRQVLSRTMIAEHVWEEDAHRLSTLIEVYMRSLRNKLCANGEPDVLQTMYEVGYQLQEAH